MVRFKRGERWELASGHTENKILLPSIFTIEGKGIKELLDRTREFSFFFLINEKLTE